MYKTNKVALRNKYCYTHRNTTHLPTEQPEVDCSVHVDILLLPSPQTTREKYILIFSLFCVTFSDFNSF